MKDFAQHRELSLVMNLHLDAVLLCRLIYTLLLEDVHLRWELVYIPIWAALLLPVALMIAVRESKRKLVVRLYSALVGIGLRLLAILLQAIGGDTSFPLACFCKDGEYLVGREYDFFDNNLIGVHKANGLIEKRIPFYNYNCSGSIRVYDSLNITALYCLSEIQEDPWPSGTTAPIRVIEQLRNYETDSGWRKKIEQLIH